MLAMSLALRLGRTLEELADSMSAWEFDLWTEFYKRSPWDDARADLHAGLICAAIANYAGKARKDGIRPASPIEFMPFARERDEELVEEEPDIEVFLARLDHA